MNLSIRLFIIFAVAISIGALAGIFYLGKGDSNSQSIINSTTGNIAGTNNVQGEDYLERLAKFMKDQGMVMYGSYQSTGTKEQKELFGSASQYLNYVECDAAGPNANPDECIGQEVSSYPTWIFQGQKYIGKQDLSDLAKYVNFSN